MSPRVSGHGRTAARSRGPSCRAAWGAVGLALAWGGASCEVPNEASGVHGTPVHREVGAPRLALIDTEGRAFDLREETHGRVTLVFFGYTHCPDICPVHMATLSAAYSDVEPEVRDRIRVVFVSTDPERDTPQRLRAWLDGYHRSFVGARGALDEINGALAGLQLPGVAVIPSEHGEGAPNIGHPSAIVAFGPDGRARVRYPFGMRRADWLRDLPRLARER